MHWTHLVKGGVGLRRVQWQANSVNEVSRKVAERIFFSLEGVMRWERVLRDRGGWD